MISFPLLILTIISGPIIYWNPLPNRTVEVMLPNDKLMYYAIIEISSCKYMRYAGPGERILHAGVECYRVSTEPFEIKR